MRFHHIGIAVKEISEARNFVVSNFNVVDQSPEIFDPNQNALLQLLKTPDVSFELVSGPIVEQLIRAKTSYYHTCYEVSDIYSSIASFKEALLIVPPTEAILFNNRLVAFLMTPIGLVELLNAH